MRAALKKIDGVISAKVDFKSGEAVVKVDRNKVTDQQLIDGLKKNSNGKYTAIVKSANEHPNGVQLNKTTLQ